LSCSTGWPRELNLKLQDIHAQKLLEAGWGGELDDPELAYIQQKLFEDNRLAYSLGFAASLKTRPEASIRRVAISGDPIQREVNLRLARPRKAFSGQQDQLMPQDTGPHGESDPAG